MQMKNKLIIKRFLSAILIVTVSTPLWSQTSNDKSKSISSSALSAMSQARIDQARLQQSQREARAQWDVTYRPVIIQNVLSRIAGEAERNSYVDWREEVQAHLEKLSTSQLDEVQGAQSYNEVITIIRGGSIATQSLDQAGELSVESLLGDTQKDLVYTPLPPCRIVDTRVTGGKFGVSVTRPYSVNGNTTGQGGAANCGVPDGANEPAAVVLNITSTAGESNGFITAYPIGVTQPNASVLNYQTSDVANAVVLQSGITGLHEIAVYASTPTHVIIDVMGYLRKPESTKVEVTQIDGDLAMIPAGAQDILQATCPMGFIAIGGGGLENEFDDHTNVKLIDSQGIDDNTWQCTFKNNAGVPQEALCHVQCLKFPFAN